MRLSLAGLFRLRLISITAVFLLAIGVDAFAQSSDARSPTPVSSNEIVDSIAARDLGDSRLTDYFYTFTGLPGDLLITVESKNLNGDLDVFTAGELRPLLKIAFYAGSTSSATKNIYLRKRESLILRVEARSPNDDPGTYQIRFSGSFEPISAALVADSEKPVETNKDAGKPGDRRTSRVSSVGARINEPVEEVVAAPTPKPTPLATPVPETEKSTKSTSSGAATPTARTRQPPPRKTPAKTPPPANTTGNTAKDSAKASDKPRTATVDKPGAAETSEAANTTNKTGGEEGGTAEAKPAPTRRAASRRTAARPPTHKATPNENRPRLLIEQKDGTRREFLMSDVRKVTVENGEIVVETNDGHTSRISMTQVARMSIGP